MRRVKINFQNKSKVFKVATKNDWSQVVAYFIEDLKPGDVVAISGDLGAGKTTFVQSLATELGIRRMPSSPTFSLMRSYPVSVVSKYHKKIKRLIHVDAYRLKDEKELMVLDLDEELADRQSLLVVEWPENIKNWINRHKFIGINIS